MKIMLLGIAFIMFGIVLNNPSEAGFIAAIIGLLLTIIGCFVEDKK